MNKTITLKDIVEKIGDCIIEYRTWLPDGTDVLSGYCKFVNNELISLDGDSYSMDDVFVKYSVSQQTKQVTIWYESKWI